ncbi:unnamed protein product [Cladocopium goreaui]|uniref:Uncharacterized protein n=1 Tax=Cladocopium goreaui TaxID=2562237 RepID=A0A9P1FXH4_9DINO|nr:unnamed protein product [Cladocopium goreaui]
MSSPQDMDPDERKRQYSALRRAIRASANPALTSKFELCSDTERFTMLKTWLVNSSLDSIEVEDRYRKVLRDDRTDRYVTMSIFQLEQKYGSDPEAQKFIADITKGQQGIDHPQSSHPKARMFKILKDVLEEKGERTEAETTARVGGRVRSAEAKKAIAEKLKKGMESLEATPLMDLKTGEIKTKKPKKVPKEKTPEEACLHEAKAMHKKLKKLVKDLPAVIGDMAQHRVQHSTELVSALKGHVDDLDNRVRDAERFAGTNIEAVEIEEFNQWVDLQKDWFNMVSRDVSDAKRRVNLTKGPAKVRQSKVDKPVVAAEPADDDVSAEEEALMDYWNRNRDQDFVRQHPVLSRPDIDLTKVVPLVIHADDAESHRRRQDWLSPDLLLVTSLNCGLVVGENIDDRLRESVVLAKWLMGICVAVAAQHPGDEHAGLRAAVFVNLVGMRKAMNEVPGPVLSEDSIRRLQECCYLYHCAFNSLATEAIEHGKLLWKIRPKYHRTLWCIRW